MPDPILDAIKAANKKSTQGYSDIYKGENNPSQYDRGMSINENDVEQFRYDRQSVLSALGNSLAKNTANFALNAVDSATFLAITPIQALFETATGTVGVDNLYSNFLSEGIDRTKEKLEELFPVYTSQGYRNDEILPSVLSMKTLDNVFNGLSYLTGEAAGIKLLAKYSPKVLGMMGRRVMQGIDEGEDLNKVGTLFAETKGLFGDFKKGKSALHDKFYQTYGAVVESAAEARQTQDQLYKQLLAEHEQKFGTITEEDQADIKKISQDAGLYNFGLNSVITGAFNGAFNKLISSKYTNNMIDSKRIIEKEGQYAIKDLDKYQKAYRGLFGEVGRNAFDEGIQEVGQFASNDFILNYFGDSSNDSKSNIDQMIEAGIKTSSKLNSREAIESGLIGALLGGGVTAISNRGQGAKNEAALKSGVEALNKQKENYQPLMNMMAKSQDKKEIMNGAMLNGDIVTYETTKNNMFFDIADAYIETGKEEDLRRDLKTSKQMLEENEEEFKKTYLVKGEFDKESALSTIDNTIEMIDKVKETRNQLMKNYGHSIDKEGIRLLTMTEIMHDDFSKREGQIIDELNSAGIDYKDFIGKRSTENIQTIQNSMTDLQSKILTEKNKDKLNEYNSEIVRLQSKLNKQLINDNYLKEVYGELNNVEESKEKKKEDKFKTAQYKKQLDDLVTIQQLKGDVMDFHNKYINSGKARDRVAEQLKKKEINQVSARDFTEGENTIDIGDRFSMALPVKDTYFGNQKPGEERVNNEFVEVTDLSVQKGKGFITFKTNNGKEYTLSATEFKQYRQNTGTKIEDQYTDYKKSYDNPEVKFFNQFKDKAIEYTYKPKDKPLKTIVGKLAFNKDGQLILKYQQVATGKNGKFVKLQTVRFQGNNQYKILSDKEGLQFDLDYINTAKTIEAEKTREKLINDKISVEKAITEIKEKKRYKGKTNDLREFESKLSSIEKQIEHLDEVELANIEDIENVYNIIPELKKSYYNKKQVPEFDISGIEDDLINLSDEDIIDTFGDFNTYNQYVNDLQSGTPEEQLELLKSKEIYIGDRENILAEYREQQRIENEELIASIQEKLPLTKENVVNILDNYIKQLNNFRKNLYTKPYFYTFNKVADPNTSTEEEQLQKSYSRPKAGVRSTGNSEKADNVFKQRFYRNIHRIDPTKHKAVLIQDNTKYDLGEGIFFLVEDQTTKENLGITTLMLPTVDDSFGTRFRLKNGGEKKIYKEIFDSGDLNSVKRGVSTFQSYTDLKSLYNKLLVKYKGKEDHTSIVKQIFEDMLLPLQQLRENTTDRVLDIDSVVLGIPIKSELRSIRETVDQEYLDESTIYTNITKSEGQKYSEVVVGNQPYNLRVGQTYIKNDKKGNVIRIQGQKISREDSTNLINGLIALQKDPASRHLIKETLNDRFYFNSEKNKSFLDYYFNDEAELVYSYEDDTRLVLKFSDLIDNPAYVQEVIDRISDNIYYSVSNEKLKNNEFYRFKDIDSDGNIVESNRTYDSYSDYVKETFSTNLVPLGNKQFENGHINFDLKIDKTDLIEEQKEEIKEQTAKAGSVLDKFKALAKEEETPTTEESNTEEVANDPFAEDDELAASMAAAKSKGVDISGSSLATALTKDQSSEPPVVSKLANEANKFNDFLLSTDSELEYQGFMEQEDYDKAAQRIKDRYDIDLEIVENLVETEGAWGKVTRFADVILNNKAILGTDFHEEFHIVSNFALTPEEQQKLYKESGQTEEELAEDYRYYALGMEKKGFIKEAFDKITKFLKRILSLNNNQSFKNEVFANIYNGKYKLRNKKNNFPHYSKAALTEAEKTKVFDRGLHIASKFIRGVLNKENPNLGLIQAISDGKLLSELLDNDEYVGKLLGRDRANLLEGSLGASLNQLDLLERANNNPGIENEFKIYAQVKLKVKIQDVEEEIYELLGEEKPKDSLGSVESNTINHFEKAQSKLRLFLYSITEEGEPYGLDRALNKLYKDLVNKHDSKEFFDFIRTSKEPFYQQITEKLLLNQTIDNKEDYNNVLKFQSTFYAQLAKMKNEYMVLKVEKNQEKERVYFINATKEKHIEQLIDKYYTNLKNNFVDIVNTDNIVQAFENIGIRLPNIDIKQNFAALENSYSFIKKGVQEAADLKGKEVKTKVRSSLVALAEIELANTDSKAVYNVYNAGGKPVFTIQNFHGLFKRFPNNRIVPLNGIQSDLFEGYTDERGNFRSEVVDKDITTPKLGLSDLNALYFNSVMDGITPYTFAGDKSTLWGIELTPTIGKKTIDLKPPKTSKADFIATKLRPIIEASYEYELGIFNNGYTDDFMAFFKTADHQKISFKNKTKEEIAAQKTQLLKFYKDNKNKLIAETVKEIEERAIATEKYFYANGTILQLEENGKPRYNDYPFFTYEALYTMGQMEMTREIGDLAFYNDPTKRLYGLTSAKSNIRHDKEYIDNYNKLHGTNISEQTRSIIVNDVYVKTGLYDDANDDQGNNASDAQGYISYDSALFMMRSSGMFDENAEKLDKILSNPNSTIEQVEKASEEFESYLKALKPQGFGYNEEDRPVFYKLSVIPLHKHFTKGKNIDYIREIMEKGNLDMVMFKSANKVGTKSVKNLYDPEGNFNTNLLNDVKNDSRAVHYLDWKWFNIQVETSDRHNDVTSGTQARKQVMIDLPETFTRPIAGFNTRAELVAEHSRLNNLKTDNMLAELTKELDLNPDFTPKSNSSLKRIKIKLLQEAISRDTPREFQRHIERLETYDLINNKFKLESIILSMLDMTKHKMFGDMKVQVSSVGFEKKDDNISKDKALSYRDGKMEVYLPYHYAKYFADKVTLNPETNIYELNSGVELPAHIGYRIPTQYINAIDTIVIKGFTPSFFGNSVVVPFEITTKTGSDFDVDKLSIFFPKYKKTDKGYEYDTEDVDNKIIELYNHILDYQRPLVMEPNNQEIINPIFDDIQKDKGVVTALSKKDFLNPSKITKKTFGFKSAKDTLGIQAVNSSSHAVAQMFDVEINDIPLSIDLKTKEGRVYKTLSIPKLSTLLSSFDKVVSDLKLSKLKNVDGQYISQVLSQTVDATVDVAAQDKISAVNFNPETSKVANLLIRSGVSTREIFYLLNNPAVIEYIEQKYSNKSGTSISKSNQEHIDYRSGKVKVVDNINTYSKDILALYMNLEHHGDKLDTFNKVITFDTKGVGTNTFENLLLTKQYEINEQDLRNYFKNFDKVFDDTFIGKFKNLANNVKNQTDLLFPLKKMVREINDQTIIDIINSKTSTVAKVRDLNKRESRIATYFIQKHLYNKYQITPVGNEIKELRKTYDNKLLNDLVISEEDGKEVISLYNGSSLNTEESNQYSKSWLELYDTQPSTALKLAIHSYFQSGTINSPITLFNIIPYNIKKELDTNYLKLDDLGELEEILRDSNIQEMFNKDIKNNIKDNTLYSGEEIELERGRGIKDANGNQKYTDEQILNAIKCL